MLTLEVATGKCCGTPLAVWRATRLAVTEGLGLQQRSYENRGLRNGVLFLVILQGFWTHSEIRINLKLLILSLSDRASS